MKKFSFRLTPYFDMLWLSYMVMNIDVFVYCYLLLFYILSKFIVTKTSYLYKIHCDSGHAVAQLVEALCYKPEGRGFDFRWCHWNFSLT
jgi:hypothetical protein